MRETKIPGNPYGLSITYDGVTYPSLADACRHLGLDDSKVRSYRFQHQLECSDQEVLRRYLSGSVRQRQQPVHYQDRLFPSLAAACRELNLNYPRVRSYHHAHPDVSLAEILDKYANE